MIATIKSYQALTNGLKVISIKGTVIPKVYVVEFGPVAKICTSPGAATRYLKKMGFMFNLNCEWESIFKSEDQLFLEKNYQKVNN